MLESLRDKSIEKPRGQRGFTLLELMCTVAVAGVVLGVGVPSMTAAMQNSRMVSQANEIVGTLNMARAESLKQNLQVTVCKSSNSSTCNTNANWQAGWIVFVDDDADGTRDVGGTPEELIWSHGSLNGSNTIVSAAFDDYVAFLPNGMTNGSTANTGSFRLCDARGVQAARDISVGRTGHPAVAASSGGSC